MAKKTKDPVGSPGKIVDLVERSDIDRDDKIDPDSLGEDWGDGFFVQTEPVLIKRDAHGNIARTIPLSEVAARREMMLEAQRASGQAVEVDPIGPPNRLSREDKQKLVFIIAKHLWDWYKDQGRLPNELNPLYDGIPTCHEHPEGCPLTRCEKKGRNITRKYASESEVLDWLVRVVGARATLNINKSNQMGYRPTLTLKREI